MSIKYSSKINKIRTFALSLSFYRCHCHVSRAVFPHIPNHHDVVYGIWDVISYCQRHCIFLDRHTLDESRPSCLPVVRQSDKNARTRRFMHVLS